MLTIEVMNQITKEVTLGMPPSLQSPAAKLFREQVTQEIQGIIQQGRIVELPAE